MPRTAAGELRRHLREAAQCTIVLALRPQRKAHWIQLRHGQRRDDVNLALAEGDPTAAP